MVHGNLSSKGYWHAWVLAGCGAKGAFQAGVIASLDSREPAPDLIVGCSAGALNAAGFSHLGPIGLKDFWFGVKGRSSVLATRWNPLTWGQIFDSVYDPAPLKKLLASALTKRRLRDFTVVYSDLKNELPVYVVNPSVEDILASASIPGIFPPVDGYKVDGGLFEICPLKHACDLAPDEGGVITVIMGNNPYEAASGSWTATSMVDTVSRSLECILTEVMINDLKAVEIRNSRPWKKAIKVRVIAPKKNFPVSTIDFNAEKIKMMYHAGKDAVIQPLP